MQKQIFKSYNAKYMTSINSSSDAGVFGAITGVVAGKKKKKTNLLFSLFFVLYIVFPFRETLQIEKFRRTLQQNFFFFVCLMYEGELKPN